MEDSEKAPLTKRTDFRSVTPSLMEEEERVVACCGLESKRLGRVPIIRTIFKKKDPSEEASAARLISR